MVRFTIKISGSDYVILTVVMRAASHMWHLNVRFNACMLLISVLKFSERQQIVLNNGCVSVTATLFC
jgi:hypothetical protein